MYDRNNRGHEEDFYRTQGKIRIKPPFWRRYLWQLLTLILLVLTGTLAYTTLTLLTQRPQAVNTLATPFPQNTPSKQDTFPEATPSVPSTPASATNPPVATVAPLTPTVVATPGLLCQFTTADQWQGWSIGSGWKILPNDNMMLNDGTTGDFNGPITLTPPPSCQPQTSDYAIEATIQVIARGGCCAPGFGFALRGNPPGKSGYSAQVNTYYSQAEISLSGGDTLQRSEISADDRFHTYRAEVKGNVITFLVDGAKVVSVIDNKFLSPPGEIGLWCASVQLQMSEFRVFIL